MTTESVLYSELAGALARTSSPVFGVAGDSNLLLVDDFVRRNGRYVPATHENAAVVMAAGYASVSGRVGLATITQGALTNCVTGLTYAARAHLPLVLIAGEAPAWDVDNVQTIDTAALAAAAEAEYLRVNNGAEASVVIQLAFHRAQQGKTPVVVGIPSDVMQDISVLDEIRAVSVPEVVAHAGGLRNAADLLAGARFPLVLAGRGVVDDRAEVDVLKLARHIGARVATTLRAKNLFDDEPENLGIMGGLEDADSARYFRNADVVIAFGASLNSYTTNQGEILAGRTVIQVDTSSTADAGSHLVRGPAGTVARSLLDILGPDARRLTWSLKPLDPAAEAGPQTPSVAEGTVDYASVLGAIDSLLPDDRLLTVDGGRTFFEGVRRLSVQHPSDYIHTMSTGSIGMGTALGTGAWCASPDKDRLSVVVTGDGALMLGGLAEFNTAVRIGARLLVVVMNDGCYGAEHHQLTRAGLSPDISYFSWPDFAPVAEALGGVGLTVRRLEDLKALADVVAGDRWPVLVDVSLDPENVFMDFARVRPDLRIPAPDGSP